MLVYIKIIFFVKFLIKVHLFSKPYPMVHKSREFIRKNLLHLFCTALPLFNTTWMYYRISFRQGFMSKSHTYNMSDATPFLCVCENRLGVVGSRVCSESSTQPPQIRLKGRTIIRMNRKTIEINRRIESAYISCHLRARSSQFPAGFESWE